MENERIDRIIDKHHGAAGSLIQILLEIQGENHWLPQEALERVSQRLKLPLNQVMNTATFHKAFSLIPEGRHEIRVCNGTSCHVRGSQCLIDTVQNITGITSGETDPDLKFSFKTVTCLGCCSSGPVMVVDGEYHANLEPDKTEDLLKNCD
ncbi:MAG: NAD(P)H-dependent oxidoreductase subunit E [Deltaproteobacteria bacterium]|nr:NAD(P)H-dependent oxidoreductase subunit E [Deltaproteobacteria bacterium]